jgi:hypothetical protein
MELLDRTGIERLGGLARENIALSVHLVTSQAWDGRLLHQFRIA